MQLNRHQQARNRISNYGRKRLLNVLLWHVCMTSFQYKAVFPFSSCIVLVGIFVWWKGHHLFINSCEIVDKHPWEPYSISLFQNSEAWLYFSQKFRLHRGISYFLTVSSQDARRVAHPSLSFPSLQCPLSLQFSNARDQESGRLSVYSYT